MKTKAFLLALFALGLTASVALAAPPSKGKPGATTGTDTTTNTTTTTTTERKHGKPATTGASCRPRISVNLGGTLVTAPGAAGTSFSMNVTRSNFHGKAYKAASPVTVAVDAKTKFRRNNSKSEASLLAGDRVRVQAWACKADLANDATPALTAVRVVAHPAAKEPDETTTETTTTTTSTS
jgi:hypothetical protein